MGAMGITMYHTCTVTIYLLFLFKRLLSYLIFSAYLILSLGSTTPRGLHIDMKSHSVDMYFVLGRRVLCLSLSNTVDLLLGLTLSI